MTLVPEPKIIASNLTCEDAMNIPEFDDDTLECIRKHAYVFTDKIFLTEINGEIWGFLASIFPSSTFIAFFKFELEASVMLALINNSDFKEKVIISPKIKAHPARSAERVREYKEAFDFLFEKICACLLDLDRFSEDLDTENIKAELCAFSHNLSSLVGCPINLSVADGEVLDGVKQKIDIPLFVAFMLEALCFARVNANTRSARVLIKESHFAPSVIVSFEPYESTLAVNDFSTFEKIAGDKKMPFGIYEDEKTVKIGFQPHRIEFSYLGIKSPKDWNLFFD